MHTLLLYVRYNVTRIWIWLKICSWRSSVHEFTLMFMFSLMTFNNSLLYFLSVIYLVLLPVVSKTPSVWLHGRTLARDYRYRQSKSSMLALANWTTMFQSSNHCSGQNTFHDPYRFFSHGASFAFRGLLTLHWANATGNLHRSTMSSD